MSEHGKEGQGEKKRQLPPRRKAKESPVEADLLSSTAAIFLSTIRYVSQH